MDNNAYLPIYQKVSNYYEQRILAQDYLPNQKIDSISRIMSRHKVSRETAKKVIKILIEKKLVISRAGKGTFVCPQKETLGVWGMVLPLYSSNLEQLINHLDKQAQEHHKTLDLYLHYNNPEEEMRIVRKMILKGYEAIIIVPNYDETLTSAFYKNLIAGNTKIVLADNTMAGSFFQYVIQSYDLGVKRAHQYLSQKHNGNFLLIGTEKWRGENLVFDLISQTFWTMIQDHQSERSLYICNSMNEIDKNFIEEKKISGILSLQDANTIRLLRRLQLWGYNVPQDISIVSYGNTELLEYNNPAITSVRCQYRQMAESIVNLIFEEDGKANKQIVIAPTLEVRQT